MLRLRHVPPRLLIALCIGLIATTTTRAGDDDGFRPLFNGSDLAGWVDEGGAGFVWQDGELHCTGAGDYPTWLRSEAQFENFVLRFEFKLGLYGEGGIFLHAPLHGRNSRVGFEVQVSDDTRNPVPVTISSGAIFGAIPPSMQNSRPLGEWNQVEVLFDWPQLRVTLNGEVVQDLNVEEHETLRHRLRRGYLGIQDRGKRVAYRNLEIKELPDKENWEPLFNGRNFDGWAIVQPEGARWQVVDGVIVASDGDGYLVTQQQFDDFELHAYVKTTRLANGGIFFRWNSLVPKDRGYEVQIEDIADSNNPTGSIYDVVRAELEPARPEEWYLMQIRVQGSTCVVTVDGQVAAQTDALELVRSGHIALQMHDRNATIWFKGLTLKRLEPGRDEAGK